MTKKLFEINPELDRAELAARFKRDTRVQVHDFLTRETAEEIRMILQKATPWGLAMQADGSEFKGAQQVLPRDMGTPDGQRRAQALGAATDAAAGRGDYAFRYAQYPILQAIQEGWAPGSPHELILEYINAPEFIQLARDITGFQDLVKADGQATLFAKAQFLGLHIDSHVAEGWKVAYVMNFTIDGWKPDWGGYLQFFDDKGNITQGFLPRFNTLNMLLVPQPHSVSMVAPFAPLGRYAITGWLRDR
ncbi:2OG-Fe(II) oxygenase [Erythrobacter sp. SDW2]|uniref:2OG-Fe(II) oxygenase n=1 Tax=Erythrobacter sp. SDW2 TaxID=2907154 RepID=UPI001F37ACE9|nr:2OG-Fe(II) oxygenase family protein [Erythrobacter sp. SDW2]UIP06549.1 2OG-Fe(II) oxygenase [Erythrobacter sp. SDW2]